MSFPCRRSQELEEIYASDKNVKPGWTNCAASRKFYPNNSTSKIKTSESLQYRLNISSGKHLNFLRDSAACKDEQWVKDLGTIHPNKAVFVNGSKVLVSKGCDISRDPVNKMIYSVNYKSFVTMLLIFSQQVNSDVENEIRNMLNYTLYKAEGKRTPAKLSSAFFGGHVYKKKNKGGCMMTSTDACFEEYCQTLKQSKVSQFPLTVCLMKPCDVPVTLQTDSNIVAQSTSEAKYNAKHGEPLATGSDGCEQYSHQKNSVASTHQTTLGEGQRMSTT